MVGQNSVRNRVIDGSILAVLFLITIACLIPLIHTVAVSFSDKTAADAGAVFLTPIKITTASYDKVLEDGQFFKAFLISVERVLLGPVERRLPEARP